MRWSELKTLNEASPLSPDWLNETRHVHIVGAGGIGMSALGHILLARGHRVSGSDANSNTQTESLSREGATIFQGHAASNIEGAGALVVSSAISDDNPEVAAAREGGIPVFHRAQLMAALSNGAGVSLAVSGTHGKSTTSAMIAHVLTETGANPTAILGAVYPPFGSNVRVGDPNLVVVEADESDGSFTLLHPTVATILNVEPEHLENYDDDPKVLWAAFEMFATNAQKTVLNGDAGLRKSPFKDDPFVLFYSFTSGQLIAKNIQSIPGAMRFDLFFGSALCGTFSLPVAGKHNVSNALAALGTVAQARGVKSPLQLAAMARALESFAGTLRRMERKGEAKGVLVVDDYGHHPTEVAATLRAAKDFYARPLTVVFQPHRYSRTQQLGHEFGPSFEAADRIIITELYSAFEMPIEGVSGKIVLEAVQKSLPGKPILWANDLNEARQIVLQNVASGELVVTMGAGDITRLGPQLLAALQEQG
ncbi:UDP-N-acetylmuramate--L-alanine ligase [Abditibacteriota bacterium]|nr:UDP-N-acetylmuramate--L-alanine ligase [Abditibacteriota bacterium]